jgi:hypothetical protein
MRDDQVLFSIDSGLHVVADDARWLPSEVEQSARVDLGLIRIGVPVPMAFRRALRLRTVSPSWR